MVLIHGAWYHSICQICSVKIVYASRLVILVGSICLTSQGILLQSRQIKRMISSYVGGHLYYFDIICFVNYFYCLEPALLS